MKSKFFGFVLLSLICGVALVLVLHNGTTKETLQPVRPEVSNPQVVATYGKLPLAFEINKGQTDSQVKFLSRGSGYTLFLTGSEAVLALGKPSALRPQGSGIPNLKYGTGNQALRRSTLARPPDTGFRTLDIGLLPVDLHQWTMGNSPAPNPQHQTPAVLRMKLVGANSAAKVEGADELPGKSNYFLGKDPKKWRTGVANYAKVRYEDVYPGVDVVYYGNQGKLEHDFVVSPGADLAAIKLAIEGADSLRLDEQGNLVAQLTSGKVVLNKPAVYQPGNPKAEIQNSKSVNGRFVLLADNRIGFEVDPYDKAKPLIIDPVLSYSTYLGGSKGEEAVNMAVDRFGNAYMVGWTSSGDFPTTRGAFDRSCGTDGSCNISPLYGELVDAFVTKLNPAGTTVIYSTYLGGSGEDVGTGIAVDGQGNAYVTGWTSSTDFPTRHPIQPMVRTPPGCDLNTGLCYDAFVTKIGPSGSELVYSTYLGGTGGDIGYGIAVDRFGQAYVAGVTNSLDFPLARALQTTCGGCVEGVWGIIDAFVTKVNATGTAWVYSTYLGGSDYDDAGGIAADDFGNAYVTGSSNSTDFPVTDPTQPPPPGVYVTKFSPGGSKLIYSTFLGGGVGWGAAIAVDRLGNAYVTGGVGCGLPTTPGAFQVTCSGADNDAFVTKVNAAGSKLLYSTYLGGNGDEWGQSIAVDVWGNTYVTGKTNSTDFPTMRPLQASIAGDWDAFVTILNPTGSNLFFSTYLGGSGEDWGRGIGVDPNGNVYVAGRTKSTDFPTANPIQGSYGGGHFDVFVAKIGLWRIPGRR